MATFGSNGIVLKEVKVFSQNLTAITTHTIYTVPAGRYAKVSFQNFIGVSDDAPNGQNFALKITSGANTHIVAESFEPIQATPAVYILKFYAAGGIQQFIDPMTANVLKEPNFVKDFFIYAGDILSVSGVGTPSLFDLNYHAIAEEYLLP